MRIYIGNKEIAGYFFRLKHGFDSIGIKSDLWFFVENKYYDIKPNWILRTNQRLFNFFKLNKNKLYLPLKPLAVFGMLIIHVAVFIYSLFRYDVFILNSEPFFNFWELAILKFFRKKIIFVFLGTESRPSYISGNYVQGKYFDGNKYNLHDCYKEVRAQAKRIKLIEKYADFTINHPPTALFHTKPFISWLHIGFPNDIPMNGSKIRQLNGSRIVKVLHAPSNPVSKGSVEIERIIDKLLDEGIPIEYIKLQNVPNDKVIDELEKCDFIIDELYSDIPIGGLGTEAAFSFKPVINGGYYAEQISKDYPVNVIPPACFCMPENLELMIREYATNKQKRDEDALKLNQFVVDNWDSASVAKRYMSLIDGQIPAKWLYYPLDIQYFLGYGINKLKLRTFLKGYTDKYGSKALFLDNKPELKSKVLEFILSEQ